MDKLKLKKPDGTEYPAGKMTTLNELLNYEQPTKYIVKSTIYNDEFDIPVLTAGQTLVLGYTDEKFGIYNASKSNPVIIFDDFMATFHWIDYPFKVKSSAMKILTPKDKRNSFKYIYMAMKNINYCPKDHSRQWISEYSNFEIYLPSIEEQNAIVELLAPYETQLSNARFYRDNLMLEKKAMSNKLFNQEVRFKKDDGSDFENWEEKRIDSVLKSISSKPYQVLSSEIKTLGKYEVVDQGQNLISGYSDDLSKVYNDGEIIIYGDHTTTVKYRNKEFIVGADGTKLLKPIKNDNVKFLYYVICQFNVKQSGYKRHFTDLREKDIPIPCLEEQEKIANCLSNYDTAIETQNKIIEATEKLYNGLLQRLF